jgi:hypothetical protein
MHKSLIKITCKNMVSRWHYSMSSHTIFNSIAKYLKTSMEWIMHVNNRSKGWLWIYLSFHNIVHIVLRSSYHPTWCAQYSSHLGGRKSISLKSRNLFPLHKQFGIVLIIQKKRSSLLCVWLSSSEFMNLLTWLQVERFTHKTRYAAIEEFMRVQLSREISQNS